MSAQKVVERHLLGDSGPRSLRTARLGGLDFFLFPSDGFDHQHNPGSVHSRSPRRRVMFVWEMVRARLGRCRAGVGHVYG